MPELGKPEIRKPLFLATLSAARHDPVLSLAYKNLIARCQKPMIAIRRKIIVIANAKLRDAFKNQHQTIAAI